MKRDMPKISVIMPVYNEERYVQEAIESILSQTYTDFELIIVDDASNDKSREIISSFTDERIIYIRNERNLGNFPSRNRGMRVARGKYIAVMDADDILFPERFERQVVFLDEHAEFLAVASWYVVSCVSSENRQNNYSKRSSPVEYEDILMSLMDDSCLLHPSLMISNEFMRNIGGYEERYLYAADYALLCKIVLAGKITCLPEVLMKYRWHSAQITQSYRKEQILFAKEIRFNYLSAIINRFGKKLKMMPDRRILGNQLMGRIIGLHVYALYSGKLYYKSLVDILLDDIFQQIMKGRNETIGQSLCFIGCGIIFLLRNGFVIGVEDEILEDVDTFIRNLVLTGNLKFKEELTGWIHYLLLRIENAENSNELSYLNNLQCLVGLLEYLDQTHMWDEEVQADVKYIHAKKIYPVKTEYLLFKKVPKESITIIIPVRIDCWEREANLDLVVEDLSKDENIRIILLEIDKEKFYSLKKEYQNVDYQFVENEQLEFYKNRHINMLLKQINAEWIGIWDMDVIVPKFQIYETILFMKKNDATIGYPYDGRLYSLSEKGTMLYRHNSQNWNINFYKKFSTITDAFVGGAYIVNKKKYLKVGGENENLCESEEEDMERLKRMEILNLPIYRVTGSLFRLYYPRNKSSCLNDLNYEIQNKQEFVKICAMTQGELLRYVKTWI